MWLCSPQAQNQGGNLFAQGGIVLCSGAGPSGTSGPSAPVASPKPRRSPRKRHFTPSPDCGLSPLSWLRDGLRSRDAMCVEALAERDMCTSRKRALTK